MNKDALSEECPLRYYEPWCQTSYVLFARPGYVITEEDIPTRFSENPSNPGSHSTIYEDAGWSQEPVGHTVTEACEFSHYYDRMFYVDFRCPGYYDSPYTVIVEPGGDAVPPEVPDEHNGKFFCGWNGEYTNISSSRMLLSVYRVMGDVNMDETVNTADAVTLLKHVAELEEIEEVAVRLADISDDGKINTADAVAVLKKCAE